MAPEGFEKPWPVSEGDSPALDLVNTLDWRRRKEPDEKLRSHDDLLRWARSAGIVDGAEALRLRGRAAAEPGLGERLLAEAVGIRETIAAIFTAVAAGDAPPAGALERLEEAAQRAAGSRTLRAEGTGAVWAWRSLDPDRPGLAAVLDAVRLLTGPEGSRVRQCADAECGWFFLDRSRNRSRRWCAMQACGNRNKARRHYLRRRAAADGAPPADGTR